MKTLISQSSPNAAIQVQKNNGKTQLYMNYNSQKMVVKIMNSYGKVKYIYIGKSEEDLLRQLNNLNYKYVKWKPNE